MAVEATTRVRVPFVDVDSSDRIHYTGWFRYMEVAEHTLMRSIGFPYATALRDVAFPRVHLECDFRGAIRYDDELDVTARVERVGASSWTVAFVGRNVTLAATRGEAPIVAEGRMTIVAMNPATERSQPLPEELRHALAGTDAAE